MIARLSRLSGRVVVVKRYRFRRRGPLDGTIACATHDFERPPSIAIITTKSAAWGDSSVRSAAESHHAKYRGLHFILFLS